MLKGKTEAQKRVCKPLPTCCWHPLGCHSHSLSPVPVTHIKQESPGLLMQPLDAVPAATEPRVPKSHNHHFFPAQLMVMELPVCPSLIPSQTHGPRSLGQVTMFSLGMGMMWSRTSDPCQQTIMEGSQWGPGLQETKGVRLAEPCSEQEDTQLSKAAPASWVKNTCFCPDGPEAPRESSGWAMPTPRGT